MEFNDKKWVQRLLDEKELEGPVLELGVGFNAQTSREFFEAAGMLYYGTDLEKTAGVDFAADFEQVKDMKEFESVGPFGSVLILNVLEHTFDPIRVLDNAISILKPGGKCAVITPSLWPLHNYPFDAWRILPNFYEEYAKRRDLGLDQRFLSIQDGGL